VSHLHPDHSWEASHVALIIASVKCGPVAVRIVLSLGATEPAAGWLDGMDPIFTVIRFHGAEAASTPETVEVVAVLVENGFPVSAGARYACLHLNCTA
jgi:hypothetical protein